MFTSMIKSFLNLFKKPQTLAYPAGAEEKPASYRGLIEYSEMDCIYCLKCEKACPPKAILFPPVDTPPSDNPKNKKSLIYEYNPWLCIYCGECVRACPLPGEALWQSSKKQNAALADEKVNDNWDLIEARKGIYTKNSTAERV